MCEYAEHAKTPENAKYCASGQIRHFSRFGQQVDMPSDREINQSPVRSLRSCELILIFLQAQCLPCAFAYETRQERMF